MPESMVRVTGANSDISAVTADTRLVACLLLDRRGTERDAHRSADVAARLWRLSADQIGVPIGRQVVKPQTITKTSYRSAA